MGAVTGDLGGSGIVSSSYSIIVGAGARAGDVSSSVS